MKRGRISTWGLLAILCLATPAIKAEGVRVIEDCESYEDSLIGWTVSDNNNISVTLGLGKLLPVGLQPINGARDINVSLGASILGSSYTLSNTSFDVDVPAAAESLKLKLRPLVALNVGRSVKVKLHGEGGATFESKPVSLSLLTLNAVSDIEFKLSEFTPPVTSIELPSVKGVDLTFNSNLANLAAGERIDDIRLTWDNANVSDWMCY